MHTGPTIKSLTLVWDAVGFSRDLPTATTPIEGHHIAPNRSVVAEVDD